MSILGFSKQIKPEYEIISLGQRSYETPKFLKMKARIRKLILFGPKCPNLGIWDQNFQKKKKKKVNLKSAHPNQVICKMSLRLES